MSIRPYFPLAGALVVFVLLSGCGSSNLVPVKGVLTYKGAPIANVHLDFLPENGRPSWGQTDAEGRFTLEYDKDNKGAVVGKHKVLAKIGEGWQKTPGEPVVIPKELNVFFEKYGVANSTVVVEIDANSKNIALAWD